jgi:hypothetical protein
VTSISTPPDDVLLLIFDICVEDRVDEDPFTKWKIEMGTWQSLVHVCRKWRIESPRRLNLRIMCTQWTPARDMLDAWPAFPVLVSTGPYYDLTEGEDNIVAALKHSDRIYEIEVTFSSSPQLKKVLAAMREPFPELSPLAAPVEC